MSWWTPLITLSIVVVLTVTPSKLNFVETFHDTESLESGKWDKINLQKALPRIRTVQGFIFGKTFYPNLESFVWRRHVSVPFRGTNMAAGNQQKHLFLSFPTDVWIRRLRNSKRLKWYLFWGKECLDSKISQNR